LEIVANIFFQPLRGSTDDILGEKLHFQEKIKQFKVYQLIQEFECGFVVERLSPPRRQYVSGCLFLILNLGKLSTHFE